MRRRRPRLITIVLFGVPAAIAAYLLVLELVMAPIRTLPANAGCALMMADGTLHGDRWTSPYVWLDTTGFGDRFEVIWPHGYSRGSSLALSLSTAPDGSLPAKATMSGSWVTAIPSSRASGRG